jgi:hypothetical protein
MYVADGDFVKQFKKNIILMVINILRSPTIGLSDGEMHIFSFVNHVHLLHIGMILVFPSKDNTPSSRQFQPSYLYNIKVSIASIFVKWAQSI